MRNKGKGSYLEIIPERKFPCIQYVKQKSNFKYILKTNRVKSLKFQHREEFHAGYRSMWFSMLNVCALN